MFLFSAPCLRFAFYRPELKLSGVELVGRWCCFVCIASIRFLSFISVSIFFFFFSTRFLFTFAQNFHASIVVFASHTKNNKLYRMDSRLRSIRKKLRDVKIRLAHVSLFESNKLYVYEMVLFSFFFFLSLLFYIYNNLKGSLVLFTVLC